MDGMRWIAAGAVLLVALLLWALLREGATDRTTRAPRHSGATKRGAAATRDPGGPGEPPAASRAPEEAATAAHAPTGGLVVSGDAGEPVAGARVTLHDVPQASEDDLMEAPPGVPLVRTHTDGDGRFELTVDHEALVRVVAPGYLPAHLRVAPGDDPNVELVPAIERTFVIVDLDDRPIDDATVRVRMGRDPWPVALARSDGRGRVTVAVADQTCLVVSAAGCATTVVQDPERCRDTRIVLRPGVGIAGVVVTAAGDPIADARVVLDPPFRFHETVITEADGRFEFEGLDPRHESTLRFEHAGYESDWVVVVPGSIDLRYVLMPKEPVEAPVRLRGEVVDATGAPVAGASVASNGAAGRTTTDAEGRFSLPAWAGVTCTLWVHAGALPALPGEEKPPSALRAETTASAPGPPVRIVVEAIPRSFLALRFVDVGGRPVRNVGVRPGVARSPRDREGRMLVAVELPAGSRARLVAWRGMFQTPFEALTHPQPDCPEQEVVLAGHPRADLVVRMPDGSPLPPGLRAKIELYPTQALPLAGTERPDGVSFEFDPDAAPWCKGKLFVTISAPGYRESRPRPPLPGDGGTVVVRLERGVRVTGWLADGSGEPLDAEGWVQATPLEPASRPYPVRTSSERGDGRFELPIVPAVRLRLLAGRHADAPQWQGTVDARDGRDVDLGTIRLPPSQGTSGHVVDEAGRPLSGVRIIAEGEIESRTVTDGEGVFRLPLPGWTKVRVLAIKQGHGTRCVPLGEADRIVMPAPGSVLLTILRDDPPDRSVLAWSIEAAPPGADWSWQPAQGGEATGDRMIRRYVDLPPGPLEFRLETVNGVSRVTIDVIAGRTVEATLRFP